MLAIATPVDSETIRAIEIALGKPVKIAVATPDDIDAALATTLEPEQTNNFAAPAETATAEDNLDDLRDLARGAPVVRAVDEFLRLAVDQRATDLHIEPFAGALQVRLRIDGILKGILSTTPQHGERHRISDQNLGGLKHHGASFAPRRTGPYRGQRRRDRSARRDDADDAWRKRSHPLVEKRLRGGLARSARSASAGGVGIIRKALQAPFGMIIVTGPTGSGKTTTLAASLAAINDPTRRLEPSRIQSNTRFPVSIRPRSIQ